VNWQALVASPLLTSKVMARGLLTSSIISAIIYAAAPASASEITSIGIQLSAMNKMCRSLHNAYVLHPSETAQLCVMRDSIVRTKNGLRYIMVYSFTDLRGIVDHHSLKWFEVDCSGMLKREFRDGSILLVREIKGRSIGARSIDNLRNGWFLYVLDGSPLPGWEPLLSDVHDRAVARSCQVSSKLSPNMPSVATWGSEMARLLYSVKSRLSRIDGDLQTSNMEIALQSDRVDVLDSTSFRPALA